MRPHGGGRTERTRGERTAEAAAKAETKKERTARQDWAGLLRKSFALDVFACGSGDRSERRGGRLYRALNDTLPQGASQVPRTVR